MNYCIFCLLVLMKIMRTFHIPFRLNYYNILDYSGCFYGIPLPQFESNVPQWKPSKVGWLTDTLK